jgi:hypothetical protein
MKLWIFAAVAVVFAGAAFGQPAGGGRGAVRAACQADIAKFCGGVERGGGRVMACMRDHQGDLSDGCRSAMMSARAARRANGGTPPPDAPAQPQS